MKRDAAVPALAVLLVLLALPVTGLVTGTRLPSSPTAYYPIALGICALFLVAVGPARRGGALRPLRLALASSPFLVFAFQEGRGLGASGVPSIGWFAALGAATAIALAHRYRAPLGAALVLLLGGGVVLAAADLPLLPDGWNAIRHPLAPEVALPEGRPEHPDRRERGIRSGAPTRLAPGRSPALGSGPGPWWVRARQASHPGPRPVVLLLERGPGPGAQRPVGEVTLVDGRTFTFGHAFDLGGFDALIVRERAWPEDDPQAPAKAAAVAHFVRAGGLLIGPDPRRAWPPHLGRLLGRSGRGALRGIPGIRHLGLGHIARAGTREDAEAVLGGGYWVPEVESALGRRPAVPVPPTALLPWRDDPAGRRPIGILLLAYVTVLAALCWLVPGPGTHLLALLLVASAVCGGIAWLSPREAGFAVHGLALDLGGPGGRRVEAVLVSAGPRGFKAPVRWAGGGIVSLHGGRLAPDGDVVIAPGRFAWIAREREGRGVIPGDVEDRRSAFLRPLLLGEADPARLRYGRVPVLPVHIPGVGAVPAATLTYRRPPP